MTKSMMKVLPMFAIVLLMIGCGGYKDDGDPLSPEEVQVTEMATTWKDAAHSAQQAAPAALQESVSNFSEATLRFQNLCLRYGSNSLEARKAFDRVMFYESQITQSQELASSADFNKQWQALRTGTLREIAEKLGYRPEKLEN